FFIHRSAGGDRQLDCESASKPGAITVSDHLSAVQLDDRPRDRKPQPQTPEAPVYSLVRLGESFKNKREEFGTDSHTRIYHLDHYAGRNARAAAVSFQHNRRPSALGCKLHSVSEQVGNDLLHAHRVYVADDRLGGQVYIDGYSARLGLREHVSDGCFDERS